MKNRAIVSVIIAAVLLLGGEALAESPDDILIVANNSVAVDTISIPELKAVFLKEKASLRGGSKVVPMHAKEGSPLRMAFQKKVLAMEPSDEQSFWQEQKIRKGLAAPAEFSNSLKAVFSVKGGIGYCFRKQFKEGLAKVLLVLP